MTAIPQSMAAFLYVSGLRSNHWFASPSITDVFEAARTNHGFLCPLRSLQGICTFELFVQPLTLLPAGVAYDHNAIEQKAHTLSYFATSTGNHDLFLLMFLRQLRFLEFQLISWTSPTASSGR